MVKFTAETPTGILIGLGLSRGNVEKLMKGMPIDVDMVDWLAENPTVGHIVIFFGETEEAMRRQLESLMPGGN